ncbi:MAG: hypothetical protein Fur0010_05200 [Bdellovibrio sp.]
MRLFANSILATLALLITTSCGEKLAHAELFQVIEFNKQQRDVTPKSFFSEFKDEEKITEVKKIPSRKKITKSKKNIVSKNPIKKAITIKTDTLNHEDQITITDSAIEREISDYQVGGVKLQNIISLDGFEITTEVEKLDFEALIAAVAFPKEESLKIAQAEKNETQKVEEILKPLEQIVSTELSSAVVAAEDVVKQDVVPQLSNDDIVAFEYSKKETEETKNGPISNNVMGALSRIYNEKNVAKVDLKELNQIVSRNESAHKRNEILAKRKAGLIENGTTIQVVKVHLGIGTDNLDNAFEYSDSINDTESELADHDGKIVISHKGLLSGVINSPNSMPTSVEYFADGSLIYVPVIGLSSLRDFTERKEIDLYGGHVLVELTDALDDVEIDANYNGKILLNERFREVQKLDEASFVLFLGVEPGNTTVKYKIGTHFASTVRLVVEDELTYESRTIESNSLSQHIIDFWLPLGRTSVEESIDHLSIIPFLNTSKLSKIGINGIKVENTYRLKDAKEYLQVTDEEGSRYFINLNEKSRITVPTKEINNYLFKSLNLPGLENACLVVINVENISAVDAVLQTVNGNQKINIYSLSDNGQFNYEVDESTRKIIFTAQDQGVIRYRFTDIHGKSYSGKSYCSLGAYLIE